jgi:flagellar export protein FliJ
MAFRFSLETVLRLRQNLERQEELLLYKANQDVLVLKHQIDELDAGMAGNAHRQSVQLQAGVSAAELHFDLLCHATLLHWRDDLEKRFSKAQSARDSRAESFRRARRQREAIETLRNHQLQLYRQQEARQDQRRADDLFLLRRSYRQRS